MTPLGLNFQSCCQSILMLCGVTTLLKGNYVVDGMMDLVESLQAIVEDLQQISVLLHPIGQCQIDMAEHPMAFDHFTFADLVLVQHEEVLHFSEKVLYSISRRIDVKDLFSGKTRVIRDQGMAPVSFPPL